MSGMEERKKKQSDRILLLLEMSNSSFEGNQDNKFVELSL